MSTSGKGIKIGDLGLATTDGKSVMGTPEFMAPEMYETGYRTSVDIYAFGLCLLEMVTGRTPYCELTSVVAVYKRVLAGQLPENMRVLEAGWPEAYAFVLRCLCPLPEVSAAASGAAAAEDDDAAAVRAGHGELRHPAHGGRARGNQADGRHVMATAVILPRLGQGMEAGTIVRW
jgi:serine/threonine protein kinase